MMLFCLIRLIWLGPIQQRQRGTDTGVESMDYGRWRRDEVEPVAFSQSQMEFNQTSEFRVCALIIVSFVHQKCQRGLSAFSIVTR